jgi:hypothetical protein
MKNNPFDGLNYQNPKRTAVDDFAEWYKQNRKTAEPEKRSEIDMIRDQYKKDPESLSPIQRLILGFADLTDKNHKESLERQAKSYDQQQKFQEQQEMISVKSKEFKTLADNIAALQAEFQRLNGGGE